MAIVIEKDNSKLVYDFGLHKSLLAKYLGIEKPSRSMANPNFA